MAPSHATLLLTLLLIPAAAAAAAAGPITSAPASKVCVIGSGIAGSSVAHFLKQYTCSTPSPGPCLDDTRILERHAVPGGRMATVAVGGATFEAGASIIHPKNLHALRFTELLNLSRKTPSPNDDDSWFGIWDGSQFVFKTLPPPPPSSSAIYKKFRSFLNSFLIFRRYGLSLLRMNRFVESMVRRFLKYYESLEDRPVFGTVEEMLRWSGLYELTHRSLEEELTDTGLSPRLISELVTVITRINYGQSVSISGLAGAVSLAGSDSGLWSVDGGNWQIAAGLINYSNATLHLHEEVNSISYLGGYYVVESAKGNQYNCEVTVIATPLDELNISFNPPVSIPGRRLHHTFATFVRGLLNPKYFNLHSASEIPDLVGTVELPGIPFSSVSVLKTYSQDDKVYKMFSRAPVDDGLLDLIFSIRKETVQIDWPAYPHFKAPEVFAPFVLDGLHLYYINSFENAASTIETSVVAAENVARLIISRLTGLSSNVPTMKIPTSDQQVLHTDL